MGRLNRESGSAVQSDARSFATRLRALRAGAGISAGELARRTGVSRQMISDLELDKKLPGWSVACRLAEALGVSLDAFRD